MISKLKFVIRLISKLLIVVVVMTLCNLIDNELSTAERAELDFKEVWIRIIIQQSILNTMNANMGMSSELYKINWLETLRRSIIKNGPKINQKED